MVFGPLTGGSFNPARWFGPALVGNEFADAWVYVVALIVGGLLAAALYKLLIEPASGPDQESAGRGRATWSCALSPAVAATYGRSIRSPGGGPGGPGGPEVRGTPPADLRHLVAFWAACSRQAGAAANH